MASGQALTLDRLRRLIPPPAPSSGLPLARLIAASYFLGDWQDAQATTMEQQLFVGAVCRWASSNSSTLYRVMPVPPSLRPPSDPYYAPANPDPRMALWAAYDATSPFAVSSPLPTTSDLDGAAGAFLDAWGSAFGNTRRLNETDTNYAIRILTDIARPSTTNYGLAAILDAALGVIGTQVLDAAMAGGYLHFNTQPTNQIRIGSSAFTPSVPALYTPVSVARAGGFIAGNSTLAGCLVVKIPMTRAAFNALTGDTSGSGLGSKWVNTLLTRRKAAGTQCTFVYCSDDAGY